MRPTLWLGSMYRAECALRLPAPQPGRGGKHRLRCSGAKVVLSSEWQERSGTCPSVRREPAEGDLLAEYWGRRRHGHI